MSARPVEDEEAPHPDRDPRLGLHFRALPISGSRKAFRLEEIYWEALEAIAQRNGRSLVEEVAATLARAGEGGNDAAALRASVTSDLYDLWRVAASRHVRLDWTKIVAEMPAQAFAMTAQQALVTANPFLLRRLTTLGLGKFESGFADLKVTVDPAVITQIERRRAYIDCSVAFQCNGSRLIRRVRLGPASDGPGGLAVLMGYVEP